MFTTAELLDFLHDCRLDNVELKANLILGLIDGRLLPNDIEVVYNVIKHHWKIYDTDNTTKEDILMAIDILLENHGVEYVKHCGVEIYYSNAGDTYTSTICLVDGNFIIASWGGLFEDAEERDFDDALYMIGEYLPDNMKEIECVERKIFGWLFENEKPTLSMDIIEDDVIDACKDLFNYEEVE